MRAARRPGGAPRVLPGYSSGLSRPIVRRMSRARPAAAAAAPRVRRRITVLARGDRHRTAHPLAPGGPSGPPESGAMTRLRPVLGGLLITLLWALPEMALLETRPLPPSLGWPCRHRRGLRRCRLCRPVALGGHRAARGGGRNDARTGARPRGSGGAAGAGPRGLAFARSPRSGPCYPPRRSSLRGGGATSRPGRVARPPPHEAARPLRRTSACRERGTR